MCTLACVWVCAYPEVSTIFWCIGGSTHFTLQLCEFQVHQPLRASWLKMWQLSSSGLRSLNTTCAKDTGSRYEYYLQDIISSYQFVFDGKVCWSLAVHIYLETKQHHTSHSMFIFRSLSPQRREHSVFNTGCSICLFVRIYVHRTWQGEPPGPWLCLIRLLTCQSAKRIT